MLELSNCFNGVSEKSFILRVYVQPKSSQNLLVGVHGQAVKVKICTPPTDGKANKQLIKILANMFNVPKADIQIVSGKQNRNKRVQISGVSVEKAKGIISSVINKPLS